MDKRRDLRPHENADFFRDKDIHGNRLAYSFANSDTYTNGFDLSPTTDRVLTATVIRDDE